MREGGGGGVKCHRKTASTAIQTVAETHTLGHSQTQTPTICTKPRVGIVWARACSRPGGNMGGHGGGCASRGWVTISRCSGRRGRGHARLHSLAPRTSR